MACAASVPLAFTLTSNDVFELTKQVVLRTVLGGSLLIALAVCLWRGDFAFVRREGVWERLRAWRRLRAVWVASAVALVWTLATAFSVAPAVSLWGSSLRWQGLRTQIAYIAVFLTAAAVTTSWRRARRFLAVSALVGAILGAYGLLQRAGLDPLPWSELSRRYPIATFGNQVYFGAYLVETLLLTVGLVGGAQSGNRRAVWIALAALQALALLLTFGRGAWLGAAAGIACFGALLMYGRLVTPRVAGVALSAGAAAFGLVALVVAPVRARLLSFFDPSSAGGTGALRLEYWRAVPEHWLARPPLGYGPDTQSAVFEWRALRAFREEATDRAHNALFDALMVSGAAGVLVLLAAAAMTLWCAWRVLRDLQPHVTVFAEARARFGLVAGLVSALVAHGVEQLFNLEVVAASLVAWTLAGVAFALAGQAEADDTGAVGDPRPPDAREALLRPPPAAWAKPVAVALLVVGLPALVWWQTRPLAADIAYKSATLPGLSAAARARFLSEATAAWPHEPELWLSLGEALAGDASSRADDALAAAERGVSLFAASPRAWSRLGGVSSALAARTGDTRLAERSRAAHTRATTLGSQHWRNWHYLGETEFRLGAYAAAQAAFSRALSLHAGDAGTWAGLGNAAVRTGDLATARRAFETVVRLKPNDPEARRALAAVGG